MIGSDGVPDRLRQGAVAWTLALPMRPLPQASSRSSSRGVDEAAVSGERHAVEHGRADGRFRALARRSARKQAWADDRLEAAHCWLNKSSPPVAGFQPPVQPLLGSDQHNALVAQGRVVRAGVAVFGRAQRRFHQFEDGCGQPLVPAQRRVKTPGRKLRVVHPELRLRDVASALSAVHGRHGADHKGF